MSEEQTQLLREMRDLLRVMAEPALARRDQKFRDSLRQVVGKSKPRAKAVLLMDGSRNQATLRKESGMDQGNLSRLVKALRDQELVGADEKYPRLAISVPPNFFEESTSEDE